MILGRKRNSRRKKKTIREKFNAPLHNIVVSKLGLGNTSDDEIARRFSFYIVYYHL